LKRKNLKLKKAHFKILQKEKITNLTFFKLTKKDFHDIGFALSLATVLVKFIKDLSQKLQNYSLLKTLDDLKEMLCRNKVNREDKINIKQFTSDR